MLVDKTKEHGIMVKTTNKSTIETPKVDSIDSIAHPTKIIRIAQRNKLNLIQKQKNQLV